MKNLKTDINEQRFYLSNHLTKINDIVNAVLGIKIPLKIVEKTNNRENYFDILSSENIKNMCGIMKKAFDEVTIGTFNVSWFENGVDIRFVFFYKTHNGSNAVDFCRMQIINNMIELM